ncbi:ATP-dependent DNA helicase DinG [Jeotgalibacillus campisalis]|uniref:3'-5' exonuclease DinG n=1 Tax=Jeotgalibacillus campisalis TaxID=220754 RepID=A0A0C2S205_9BACL|nr:ATP-dependent DNA helicase DinG [Jeotgalibacillus campisalis]KIL48034.1 ATP-dependent DNA helicase/DNA polymerase III subunit epsilon [Jeotgalibacillus campisalis]
MWKNKMAVVDIETTGNAPKKGDRIMQIAIVMIEDNKIVDEYSSYVDPQQPIPPFIVELTGITNKHVQGAPLFAEIAHEITKRLDGAVFVAHNVQFDLPFIQAELELAGFSGSWHGPLLDTVELARVLLPTTDSFKLSDLTSQFKLSHDRPHQADSDALATAHLLLQFIKKLHSLPLVSLEKLGLLSVYLKSNIAELFESIIEDNKKNIKDLPYNMEVFRGIALKRKPDAKMENNSKVTIGEPEQVLESHVAFYEKRESQLLMIEQVKEAMNKRLKIAIEAGTGVGKTMGYLLPAAEHALNGKKTVISTQTVQLQEQILLKEAKMIQNITGDHLKFALLKGRNHYLHLLKFEQALAEEESQYDVVLTKMQILTWLTETDNGDVDELNLTSGGRLFWNRVRHAGWFLGEDKDPWKEKDFYLNALKKADDADIIITNHSMLVQDTQRSRPLIPVYSHLIIDEAHHFEDACRRQWGKQLDYIHLKYTIGQLGNDRQDLLAGRLSSIIRNSADHNSRQLTEEMVAELSAEADAAFYQLSALLKSSITMKKGQQKYTLSIEDDIRENTGWKQVQYAFERLLDNMKKIDRILQSNLEIVKKNKEALSDSKKAVIEEIHSFLLEWNEWIQSIRLFFIANDSSSIIWLEGDIRSLPGSLSISSRKVHVQNEINDHFFAGDKAIIFTSATLTIDGTFDYFLKGLGGDKLNVKCSIYPSPFNYSKAVRLMVPKDLPDIKSVPHDEYVELVTDHLIAMGEATKGRMLVLFTSHEMLRHTYELMKDSGLMEDFVLMAQGITSGSRTKLTRNFQRFDKAILFGTSSFWEGIDIPGEDLSCLVMVRLPFSPPDEPLTKALWNDAKAKGENPFKEVSLPKAVIRFRQGFGRLIRHENDRGLIIVFDRRLITTSYGSHFLSSIPSLPVEERELDSIVKEIEHWL